MPSPSFWLIPWWNWMWIFPIRRSLHSNEGEEGMKKVILTITIALVMIILFSGCVNKENEQSLVYDHTLLELRENMDSYDFYSTKSAEGFEFLLKGDVEEAIIQNEALLTISKKQGVSTYLAIAGIGGKIEAGDYLFSISKGKVIFEQSKSVNATEEYKNMTRETTATQQLLGDFNEDNIVDIFDFVEF